jgi:transposase
MHRKPHSHHSPEFKEQALLKARHRGTRSLLSLAGELNMSPGTLKRWVLDSGKAAEQARGEPSLALDGPAEAWSPAQRLTALHESYALSGSALAGWCRERGVFEHQLTQWREGFCTPIAPASREATGAFRELQRQHEQLQRELRRKEKALAEVAALLVFAEKTCRRCWRARTNDVRPTAPKCALSDRAGLRRWGALEAGLPSDRLVFPQCAALAAHGRA